METIIFLIIVGILSSIFGKAKGNSNPGRTKSFSGKGFDDLRRLVESQMEIKPVKTGQISTGEPVKQDIAIQPITIEEKYQELQQKPVVDRSQVGNSRNEAPRIVVESEDIPFEKPDDKTIINGIIWGEILGEPRAKKPYFSRKR